MRQMDRRRFLGELAAGGTAFAALGGVHHTSREVSAGTEAFRGPGGE